MTLRVVLLIVGAAVFGLLATMNAAGYRYGVADQAFYVPAVLRQVDPALFPRDGALIGSQARLQVSDDLLAIAHVATGLSLPSLFLGGYALTIVALYGSIVALGRAIYASAWTIAALVFATTLRHGISKTGANTLEGYFHPRILAFAIGVFAVVLLVRRRPIVAALLVFVAALLHSTTALFFAIWIGVGFAVNDPRVRRPLAILAGVGAIAGVVILATGALTLTPMDAEWMAAFPDKDYIFPTQWSAESWLMNLQYAVLIVLAYWLRRRARVDRPEEFGLVAGCLSLLVVFLLTLPFIAFRSAFVVQLQVARVFWMMDLLATVYVIWVIAEWRPPWRAPAVAVILASLAITRGWYVLRVEHAGRPLAEIDLPDDAWKDVSHWLRDHTPKDAHVLADPGHAWRYGTSLRVSAERDVFLEDVKDASIGFYGRPIALRVAERRAALGALPLAEPNVPPDDTAATVRALAARYDLQYLVTERALPFPEVYRNTRFHVYRLS